MKNIHILPTENPSRLRYFDSKLEIMSLIPKKSDIIYQNIYITSDEEIKEGDWCINLNSTYEHKELCRIDSQIELERYAQKIGNDCKKIILTTDQDLIADGVQAIDDEFLEWFIKNPSCEFVKVIPSEFLADKIIYEVIIPQEEPKQETLEEAAENFANDCTLVSDTAAYEAFIAGAKWQAEQYKNKYSEEEVLALLNKREDYINSEDNIFDYQSTNQWFEQFKKK